MSGGVDFELIELLDADPSAFGGSAVSASPWAPRPSRSRPTWMVPAAVAVVSTLAAAAVLVAWKPWVNDFKIRLAFPAAAPATPTLTDQLVFDVPPAQLSAVSLGTGRGELDPFADAGGYFFADADATLRLGQIGTGRWALFFASETDSSADFERDQSALEVTVQGAPGQFTAAVGDPLARLAFGPLDGRIYNVVSSGISHDGTMAFAEVVTFDEGAPAVTDISALDGMLPLCSMEDFSLVNSLLLVAATPDSSQPDVVSTSYGTETDRFTVTTQRAPVAGLAPLQFLLGGEVDGTVSGEQALTLRVDATESLFALGVDLGSIVAWVEGGRLVMVTGPMQLEDLLVLAESVRPATETEWAEVTDIGVD